MICTYRNVYFLSYVVKYHAAHLRKEIGANPLKLRENPGQILKFIPFIATHASQGNEKHLLLGIKKVYGSL